MKHVLLWPLFLYLGGDLDLAVRPVRFDIVAADGAGW